MCVKGSFVLHFVTEPSAGHKFTIPSCPAVANSLPSGLNAIPETAFACPASRMTTDPLGTSQIVTSPRLPPAANRLPSAENASEEHAEPRRSEPTIVRSAKSQILMVRSAPPDAIHLPIGSTATVLISVV